MAEPAEKIIYIYPQEGPQASLISCPCDEIFYGGARGGGKSYGTLIDWLVHENEFKQFARGVCFRRTMPELEDMQDKANQIFSLRGAQYKEQKKTWHFPSGATLKMRYLDRDVDANNYQGHEYNWIAFDEAGNWPQPDPIDKLRACLRSGHGVKYRMILTGNPGGPGHNWIRQRFISPVPPMTVQTIDVDGQKWTRVFIPAKVSDNHMIDTEAYKARLKQSGPEWLVKAWLDGNWDIVAGGALDDLWKREVHVLRPFVIPSSWRVDSSFDWGSSKPFSVGWWAESDGTAAVMADGTTRHFPRGTLFQIAELYGWNGRPNEGCNKLNREIARAILEAEENILESAYGKKIQEIHDGPADASIFDVVDGKSMADVFRLEGVNWFPSDKSPGSRVAGLEAIRARLSASLKHPMEEPGLFFFNACVHSIRTIPVLPRDEKKPDDVDSKAEDHCFDMARYRIFKKDRSVSTTKAVSF